MVISELIVPMHGLAMFICVVPGTLYEGCFCCYQSDDGNFFRVQVLKFSQPLGLYFPHKEKARVCTNSCIGMDMRMSTVLCSYVHTCFVTPGSSY